MVTVPIFLFRLKYMEVLYIILIWSSAAVAAAAIKMLEWILKIPTMSF